MTGGRTRNGHFGLRCNAAVIGAVLHDAPLAIGARDFHDRDTMRHHALCDVVIGCWLGVRIVAPQDVTIGIFVVYNQQNVTVM